MIWFERLALVSLIFAAVKIGLWWPTTFEFFSSVSRSLPPDENQISHIGRIMGLALNGTLIFLTARRRLQIPAYIYIGATFVFTLAVLAGLLSGLTIVSQNAVGLTSWALQLGSAVLLLRRESRRWLKQQPNLEGVFK